MVCVVLPDPKLRSLRRKRNKFVVSGVAETTRKTRRQQLKRYKKFCRKFNLVNFPCSASQASLYASYLAGKLKPVSVRNYLSAVWYYQKLKGYEDHSNDFMYKKTLDGIERECSDDPIDRYPLSAEDMVKIHSLLDMKMYCDKIFWLALLVAYRSILRISHVIDSVHSLRWVDIQVTNEYIKIHVKTSKTDQYGRSPYDIYLTRIDGSVLCPALLLIEVIEKSRKYGRRLLTIHGKPLSYSYVNTRLKSLALELKMPWSRVSTHSLRHGGATLLKSLGMDVKDIMKRANWKSNAVYKYLHDNTEELLRLDVLPAKFFSRF